MKLLKTKKDKEQFLFWVATLESGVLRKGKNDLQVNNSSYCCLGVGVACTISEKHVNKHENGILRGSFPTKYAQPKAPEWLRQIDDDFRNRTGQGLSNRNDDYNWSHKRIAEELLKVYGPEL